MPAPHTTPPLQKAFMEGGIMPPLLGLLGDSNATVQTKGVMALRWGGCCARCALLCVLQAEHVLRFSEPDLHPPCSL